MGYYPTPATVAERVRKLVSFSDPGSKYASLRSAEAPVQNILDPCCGEGLALESLTRGTQAETHGIELDGERAKEAKSRLRQVLHAGYEQVEISPGGMSLLFLNPPYDDNEGERKELVFLRDLIETLAPSGVLVYIIPQARLSKEVAMVLASNLTQIRVWRFPDPEFEAFGQIVVLGKKTEWPMENPYQAGQLHEMKTRTLDPLPASSSWPIYAVPATGKPVLRLRTVRPEELVALAQSSPILTRVRDLIEPASLNAVGQPPTRLHVGHLGLLLAAGRLNGAVGEGAARHIVVGKPEKHIVKSRETEEDKDGATVEVEKRLETFRVVIKMLLPSGEIRRLT